MFVLMLAPFVFSTTTNSFGLNAVHAATDSAASGGAGQTPLPESSCSSALIPSLCSAISNGFSFVFGGIFNLLISAVIQLGVKILQIASYLFDILINRTIIQFGSTDAGKGVLTEGVKAGINTAWSAFRDLANILIIGFFTFIAINIILGSTTYGNKKLIARVLVIAILINFSLLFTKIIIDFSNFTATQFYNASANLHPNTNAPTTAGSDKMSDGIGGRLIDYMGVASYADSFKSFEAVRQGQGIGYMIPYAILSLIVLLGAAAVLLYGCFLLASRAILLVFLMITASLAFASYLIPGIQRSGWDRWWRSLVESAVLAPLLMLFLWATLTVAQALKYTGDGSLGTIMIDPNSAAGMGSLFSYIIILGLLFATFKVSSSFSSKIAWFNYAQMATIAPFTIGSRLAAPFLQGTLGRLAYNAQRNRGNEARRYGALASLAKDPKEAERLRAKADSLARASERRGRLASSTMNAMDTAIGKSIAKNLGLTGTLTGASAKTKGPGGYAGGVAADADAAIKRAKIYSATPEEQKATIDRIMKDRGVDEEQLKAVRDTAEKSHASAEQEAATRTQDRTMAEKEMLKIIEDVVRPEQESVTKLGEEMKTVKHAFDEREQNLQTQLKTISDPATRETVLKQIHETQATRESDLRHQEKRIEDARTLVQNRRDDLRSGKTTGDASIDSALQTARTKFANLDATSKQTDAAAEKARTEHEKAEANLDKYVQETADAIKVVREGVRDLAATSGRREAGTIAGFTIPLGVSALKSTLTGGNDVAQMVKSQYKQKTGNEARLTKLVKTIFNDEEQGGKAPDDNKKTTA